MDVQPGWEPLVALFLAFCALIGLSFAAGVGLVVRAIARWRNQRQGPAYAWDGSGRWFWGGFGATLAVEVVIVVAVIAGAQTHAQYGTTYREGQALSVTVDTPSRTITVAVKDESHGCRDLPTAQIGADNDAIYVLALRATPQVRTPPCGSGGNTSVLHSNTELGTRDIIVQGRGDDIVLHPNPDGTYDPYVR